MLITETEALRAYRTEARVWQGIPSIEVTPGGRIFVCFYSGKTSETLGNYCVLLTSEGDGFSEPIAAVYAGEEHRCFDPCLWLDPLGRLWLTWSVMPDNALYGAICEHPEERTLTWGQEFRIGHDVMMNKPTVLTTGEWLFPLSVWDSSWLAETRRDRKQEPGAFAYKTGDGGRTFRRLGAAHSPNPSFDEHMIVERNDGVLMMLLRTMDGIGVSCSWDRGEHWSDVQDSGLGGPSSRFHIRRLKSGRLLLINHVAFTGRNNLTAMLSEDDGQTWSRGLLLDGRSDVSYPDAAEGPDGFLYIVYDRERGGFKRSLEEAQAQAREILMARVTEADILAGKPVTAGSFLRRVVNRLGAYRGSDPNPFHQPGLYTDREYARRLLAQEKAETILSRLFTDYPLNCAEITRERLEALDERISRFAADGSDALPQLTEIVGELRRLSGRPEQTAPVISRIRRCIEAHMLEDWSLEQLAAWCGMSRYYMCHLFKSYTGTTVLGYRNALRFTMAKRDLIGGSKKISEIALDCGFSGVSYFTEAFLRAEGMTPTDYRKNHRS